MAIARSGAVVGLCPITEANLGDGIFDARAFRDAGGELGVGSDSNVLIDAAGELRQLEYSQRLSLRSRNVLAEDPARSTGRSLFEAALRGGSRALGTPGAGLAAGQPADIVTLAPDHPAMATREGDAWLDGWIFAARPGAIADVWARGRRVVAAGRHVDREAIAGRFRAALARILG
jgi:cytosine/adenosine deaminase-related metal-dependent hydrolase